MFRAQQAAEREVILPDWETFQRDGWIRVPVPETPTIMMQDFRDDPKAHPLETPSGKIEIYSETIANFKYDDCPGHPVWMEPAEWLGPCAIRSSSYDFEPTA